ncbi:adenylate kinase [bacterium]|jgi:adenylate kinase|nr:adenylate kinase [bacterium]
MPPGLIFLGAAGSGKGTQAQQLSEHLGLVQLSTGDILRDSIRRQTPLGLEVKKYIETGELVPDETVLGLVKEALQDNSISDKGFILDGFPRTLEQAVGLDTILKQIDLQVSMVIEFQIGLDETIKRIGGRRICSGCNKIYHVEFNPPSNASVCDICSSSLIQRKDDTEEKVRRRFEIYQAETEPLITHYQSLVHSVDATRTPKEIFEKLVSQIEALNGIHQNA